MHLFPFCVCCALYCSLSFILSHFVWLVVAAVNSFFPNRIHTHIWRLKPLLLLSLLAPIQSFIESNFFHSFIPKHFSTNCISAKIEFESIYDEKFSGIWQLFTYSETLYAQHTRSENGEQTKTIETCKFNRNKNNMNVIHFIVSLSLSLALPFIVFFSTFHSTLSWLVYVHIETT